MIEKLLVANRGEIAVRVFSTARRLGIATVAVFSDPDRTAPFVATADEAIALGGATPAESYLDSARIIEAALAVGADAIHPGYGFLSENAMFARQVDDAGLIWVGPPPEAIEVMGSKLRSKELVARAGVPILESVEVTADDAAEAAERIGYPVLVKASAGGGGKGMRIVERAEEIEAAVAGARREAAAAFGDDTVFLEKYLEAPRHVEIQVFADHTGRTFSLFERECSIQRRHQKIIEESPSPAVTEDLRDRMGIAAVDAARAVGYEGAGTVEFLFKDGEFWFLEMNTRLQVEHPVTELVTGLDLVELQLSTAAKKPLPDEAYSPVITGHAIEARLYAEDPLNGYLPVTGIMRRFEIPDSVRVDSGVRSGSAVTVHYDPMLAKVVAHAADRDTAAELLADALRRSVISGMTTNRELLVGILEHAEFRSGTIDTHFLERHPAESLVRDLLTEDHLFEAAIVAALDLSHRRRASARVLGTIPSGWRNNPALPQHVRFTLPGGAREIHVRYVARDDSRFRVETPDGPTEIRYVPGEPTELEMYGRVTHPTIAWTGDTAHVTTLDGAIDLESVPRFKETDLEIDPGSLTSPMPGKILQVLVVEDDRVEAGQPLVVLEAMKMEHTLRSPMDGTVMVVSAREGDQVEGNVVLVVVAE